MALGFAGYRRGHVKNSSFATFLYAAISQTLRDRDCRYLIYGLPLKAFLLPMYARKTTLEFILVYVIVIVIVIINVIVVE